MVRLHLAYQVSERCIQSFQEEPASERHLLQSMKDIIGLEYNWFVGF